MSDERYQPRVRNAGTKNSIQIGYDTEKLKQENRYRVKEIGRASCRERV